MVGWLKKSTWICTDRIDWSYCNYRYYRYYRYNCYADVWWVYARCWSKQLLEKFDEL